ncbi:MAG: transcriptional regulator, partial [Bacteroidales bacterium]|nr:transcriptional regulator [Bacteroidales bacterium]
GLTERGALSTELRILAVIRLGMKKSGEIARFLNVSPNTVYTYRAALKKASLVGEDAFEERVIHLLRGE